MKTSQFTQVEQILKQIREYNTQLGHVKNATGIQFVQDQQIRIDLRPTLHKVLFPAVAGAILDHLQRQKEFCINELKHKYNVEYDGD